MQENTHAGDDWSPWQRKIHAKWGGERRRIIAALRSVAPGPEQWETGAKGSRAWRIAEKLSDCCRHPAVWHDPSAGRMFVAQGRCKSRLCPRCSHIRSEALRSSILATLPAAERIRMATLTMPDSNAPLREQVAALRDAFKELRRSKTWKLKVAGGVGVIEVKWSADSRRWHPHMHILAWGDFWPQESLSQSWERRSGAAVVDIRSRAGRDRMAFYVSKYVAKASDVKAMPSARIAEYAEAMHGVRMVSTFGEAYGVVKESREKTPAGDSEHVAGMTAVAAAAEQGEKRAPRVLRAVAAASRLRPRMGSDGVERMSDRDRRRVAVAVAKLRRWWRDRDAAACRICPITGRYDSPKPAPDRPPDCHLPGATSCQSSFGFASGAGGKMHRS